jgi:hypothetical protein
MSYYANLKAFIDTDAANDAKTDADVLTWLLESVTGFIDVNWLELGIVLNEQDIDRATLNTAATAVDPETATAAQHLLDCVNAGQALSTSDVRIRNMMNAAVNMPAALRTALITAASVSVARWTTATPNLRTEPTLDYVVIARALP